MAIYYIVWQLECVLRLTYLVELLFLAMSNMHAYTHTTHIQTHWQYRRRRNEKRNTWISTSNQKTPGLRCSWTVVVVLLLLLLLALRVHFAWSLSLPLMSYGRLVCACMCMKCSCLSLASSSPSSDEHLQPFSVLLVIIAIYRQPSMRSTFSGASGCDEFKFTILSSTIEIKVLRGKAPV